MKSYKILRSMVKTISKWDEWDGPIYQRFASEIFSMLNVKPSQADYGIASR